jgi:hypothetical protein
MPESRRLALALDMVMDSTVSALSLKNFFLRFGLVLPRLLVLRFEFSASSTSCWELNESTLDMHVTSFKFGELINSIVPSIPIRIARGPMAERRRLIFFFVAVADFPLSFITPLSSELVVLSVASCLGSVPAEDNRSSHLFGLLGVSFWFDKRLLFLLPL